MFPHSTVNFYKGVFKCKLLDVCTNEEIIAGLHDQHAIDCGRVTIQRKNETIYTVRDTVLQRDTYLLT